MGGWSGIVSMFSAKSEGQTYIAGRIQDPKSRKYNCTICGKRVAHVSATTRSISIPVSEHFRHAPGEIEHPHKTFTWQVGNIMNFLVDNFLNNTGLDTFVDVETDKRYEARIEGKNLDFIVDMLVKEKVTDGRSTAIIIDSDGFNSNEFFSQVHLLSARGIYTMLVLSAYGKTNLGGKYFRPEYRQHTGETVRKIPGNEKAVYDLCGKRNIYFDHDTQSLNVVRFNDYSEKHEHDRELPTGHVIPAGIQEFETKKRPETLGSFKAFGVEYVKTSPGGLLLARPVPIIDYYFDLEKRAEAKQDDICETAGERISIMLDSMSDEERATLTKRYGKERLGDYAVE